MQFFQSKSSSKQNQIIISNEFITTPRQQEKSLQQYLFKDINKSLDALHQKEVDLTQPYGLNNNTESPQTENMNSQSFQHSPSKSIELQKSAIKELKEWDRVFLWQGEPYNHRIRNSRLDRQHKYSKKQLRRKPPYSWIAKYIRYVRLRLIQFHPNQYLSQLHFDIIDDRSYFIDTNDKSSDYFINVINKDKLALMKEEKNFSSLYKSIIKQTRKIQKWTEKKFSGCIKKFFKLIGQIQISQTIFKFWDIFMILVLIGEIMLVSLQISFDGFQPQSRFDLIQIPFLTSLFLDIIFSFFKGFQDKGVFQVDSRLCFLNYLKGFFFLDIICLMSYLIAYYSENRIIYCIYLFRLVTKYYRYQQNTTDSFQLNERFGTEYVKLMELVFTIFLLAHLFCCVWYWIGYESLQSPSRTSENASQKIYNSWIEAYDLDSGTWQEQYIASLFWVFTTMTTIGFGDIVPQNTNERIVAIGIMMLSCFIFAYSVNSIGVLLNAINEKESYHRLRLKKMNQFMNEKKISDILQSKIRCYLDYLYQEEKNGTSQNESILFDFLNKNLKDQLLVEANSQVLIKMKVFYINNPTFTYSTQFLSELAKYVQEKFYFPDDVIVNQDQIDQQIYFVAKGEVKIEVQKSGKDQKQTVLQVYKTGQSFGQYNFFTQQMSPFSSVATCVTTIKYLNYSDFMKVIKQYPEDFERFCMIRECLQLQQNFDMLNITCTLCTWGNHQEIECPLVNYKPQRNLVLCKADHSKPMQRQKSYNRKCRKPNSYSIIQIVNEQAREFQEDKGIIGADKNQFPPQIAYYNNQQQNIKNFANQGFMEAGNTINQQNNINNQNLILNNMYSNKSTLNPETNPQIVNPLLEIDRFQQLNLDSSFIEQNQRESINQINNIDLSKNFNTQFQLNHNEVLNIDKNYDGKILINLDPNFSVPGQHFQHGYQTNQFKLQQSLKSYELLRTNSKTNKNLENKTVEILKYGSLKAIQDDCDKNVLPFNQIKSFADFDYVEENQIAQKLIGSKNQLLGDIDPNYVSNKVQFNMNQQIKGDVIECDKLYFFQTYRYGDNFSFHIQRYNYVQETHRSKMLITSERKQKRRHQKTNIFNLRKSTLNSATLH